jgi:hypothetical protein
MTNVNSSTSTTRAEDTPPVIDPSAIVDQLRALRQRIPGYGQLPIPVARSIRRVAHVDSDFVQSAINAVGASTAVQSVLGRTPDDMRRDVDDAGNWTAVEDELRSILQGVTSANLTRRHRVGLAALQAYSISRQLVREEQHADLLPHVAEMRRRNKFGRRRVRGTQPPPKTPIAPAPPVP